MTTIIDFFVRIYDWIVSLASSIWSWFIELMESSVSSILNTVLDLVPDFSAMWSFLQPVQPYTAFLNKWIALDTATTLLTAYFAFIITMISVKLVVKLFIPTVG